VNKILNTQLMSERLESLKAGIIGGISLCLSFIVTILVNTLVLATYFPTLVMRLEPLNLDFLLSVAITSFCGLLFGVTYRYIIRLDNNPQLKAGGVFAFGLVRGLTQIEVGWNSTATLLPYLVLALENVLWFAIAAITLDTAIQVGWLKPFSSN
jgi:hypothetical protein